MSDRTSEPNVAELQQTAQSAREALTSSIARLDVRVKHMRSTAVNATAASGWGIAAACACWLSFAIDRHREAPSRPHNARPPLAAAVLTAVFKTAGVVLTGALLYASYRRARQLGASADASPVGQLSAGESTGRPRLT